MAAHDPYREILASRKYAHLCESLIRRICAEESARCASDKERVKAVKNRLHMIYGAYIAPNAHKKVAEILGEGLRGAAGEDDPKETCRRIMRLHASTNERLPYIDELYAWIFERIAPRSIMDIGCGFGPFAIPWMPPLERYHALDIDARAAELLNGFFRAVGLPEDAAAIDVVDETPKASVDAAFLFKLLPMIEAQKKGRGHRLLDELSAGHIVVSYPTKSLGGREKGMAAHYEEAFMRSIGDGCAVVDRRIIGNELLFIVKR